MKSCGVESAAYSQLTQKYMNEEFNPKILDRDDVRYGAFLAPRGSDTDEASYFSYGASLEPTEWSVFWFPHKIIREREHALNDGLVRCVHQFSILTSTYAGCSVPSAQWGKYQGTLTGVSHLDLINCKRLFLCVPGYFPCPVVGHDVDEGQGRAGSRFCFGS